MHQFDFYAVRGLHMRHLGEAPRYGIFKGSGERQFEEMALRAGLTVEEFDALS